MTNCSKNVKITLRITCTNFSKKTIKLIITNINFGNETKLVIVIQMSKKHTKTRTLEIVIMCSNFRKYN